MGNKIQSGFHPPPPEFLQDYRKLRKSAARRASVLPTVTTTTPKAPISKESVSKFLHENPGFLDSYVEKYVSSARLLKWSLSPGLVDCVHEVAKESQSYLRNESIREAEALKKESAESLLRRESEEILKKNVDDRIGQMRYIIKSFYYPRRPTPSEVARLLGKNEYNNINPPLNIESHLFASTEVPIEKINFIFMYMMEDLLGENVFPKEIFAQFLARIQANYYEVPYHNYFHAICHAQSMYWILRNHRDVFTELEIKALMIASLAHDVGHPGFGEDLIKYVVRWFVYDVPFLERHHVQTLFTILLSDKCNIFKESSEKDFMDVLRDMELSILSTYFNGYTEKLKIVKELNKGEKVDFSDKNCRDTAMSLLMMVCDLSLSWKSWQAHLSFTWALYEEFYEQGEAMKKMGCDPGDSMLKKNMADMPKYQISFLENLVLPMFEEAAKMFSCLNVAVESTKENLALWIEDYDSLNYS